jgi:Flp pilus assembly protein TadD
MSQRACELTNGKDAGKLKTLSAALAETGRFDEAAATVRKAQELAADAGDAELVKKCEAMRERFEAGKEWRE